MGHDVNVNLERLLAKRRSRLNSKQLTFWNRQSSKRLGRLFYREQSIIMMYKWGKAISSMCYNRCMPELVWPQMELES
jgi:hypothetical protein